MTSKFLFLNSDKPQVIVVGTKHLRERLDHIITLDVISLVSNLCVKNLGITFFQDLSNSGTLEGLFSFANEMDVQTFLWETSR